jgi:hypothetical protein
MGDLTAFARVMRTRANELAQLAHGCAAVVCASCCFPLIGKQLAHRRIAGAKVEQYELAQNSRAVPPDADPFLSRLSRLTRRASGTARPDVSQSGEQSRVDHSAHYPPNLMWSRRFRKSILVA